MRNIGGVEVMLLDYIKNSSNDKINNILIGINIGSELEQVLKKSNIKYCNVIRKNRFDLTLPFKIASILKKEKVDILTTYNLEANSLGALAHLLYRKSSLIMSEHGSCWKKNSPLIFFEKFMYRFSKFILSNSSATTHLLLENRHAPKDKIVKVVNGIDLNRISKKKNNLKLNLSKDDFVIGFVGRLAPEKDIYTLIDAFNLLHDSNIKLVIVGGGELLDKLTNYVAKLHLSNNVVFVGNVEDVASYYEIFDLFVSVPVRESYGNSLVEASYYELPIISSYCDGVIDNIKNGKTGILIKPTIEDEYFNTYNIPDIQYDGNTLVRAKRVDPIILADEIKKLMTNPKLMKWLGKNAKLRVIEHNSIQTYANNLNELYIKVQNEGKL